MNSLERECLSIGKEIQRAAVELPDGYEISIRVERGYGGVELVDPDYKTTSFDDTVDGISHCIRQAIDDAISKAKKGQV